MSNTQRFIVGEHRAEIVLELVHAGVVLTVVACTTLLAATFPHSIPVDTTGVVFGAAIGYASGRAGSLTRNPQRNARRATDPPIPGEHD